MQRSKAMTALREQMIDAMVVRGFSARTQQSYLGAVSALARHYRRSPEQISIEDLRRYFVYLVRERGLSDASCRLYLNGIRFLYVQVLGATRFDVPVAHPKRVRRIPELLTRAEVGRLVGGVANVKHRMQLLTCYGCGLRVSELVALKVRHVDGERRLLHIAQGKGAKDRQVMVPPSLLAGLRAYWRVARPREWLFPGVDDRKPVSVSSVQRTYQRAKARAGIEKVGGIHGLRHAYATHQLAAGLPVQVLQYQLGHSDIQSTLRYVHWVPGYREGDAGALDLVASLEPDHG
jgi:integrase